MSLKRFGRALKMATQGATGGNLAKLGLGLLRATGEAASVAGSMKLALESLAEYDARDPEARVKQGRRAWLDPSARAASDCAPRVPLSGHRREGGMKATAAAARAAIVAHPRPSPHG